MRWLVTGANGFIGPSVVERLLRRGDSVRALVQPGTPAREIRAMGAEPIGGDVTVPASLPAAVEGCDAVVHLAGLVKALRSADFRRVNALGTRNVGETCARARPRPVLVMVSSLSACGPAEPGRPRREEDPPAPVSHYGRSKLEGEQALRHLSGSLEVTLVRPPMVYGPGDREGVLRMCQMSRLGVMLKCGFGRKTYSLLHVGDLAEGLIAAAERGRRLGREGPEGVYFLADGEEHTWEEIMLAASHAAGRHAVVVPVPVAVGWAVAAAAWAAGHLSGRPAFLCPDKMREVRCRHWTCAIDRARRELGFEPRFRLEPGMQESAEWFRARALLS